MLSVLALGMYIKFCFINSLTERLFFFLSQDGVYGGIWTLTRKMTSFRKKMTSFRFPENVFVL